MDAQEFPRKNKKKQPKGGPKLTRKKLDRFLSSLCEAAGWGETGESKTHRGAPSPAMAAPACQGPCAYAEWRSHLDVASGVICLSATSAGGKKKDRRRDITLSVTYHTEEGGTEHACITLTDAEIRWVMEALWHAPIWS